MDIFAPLVYPSSVKPDALYHYIKGRTAKFSLFYLDWELLNSNFEKQCCISPVSVLVAKTT